MSNEQLTEFKQFGDRVSRDATFMNAIASDSREARDMTSRLTSMKARTDRSEASLAERTAFSERVSAAYERGETISIDMAQDPHNLEMFTRYAEQYGGSSSSAHTLMAAELARQSLRPNRVFSDGTALPMSFEDLRGKHAEQRGDTGLGPNLGSRHRSNERQISRLGNLDSGSQPMPKSSPTRDEVQTRGAQIRSSVDLSQADFDAKAEIVKTDDGTLASRWSLLKQAGKQVGKDAGATVDNVKDAVKDLLRK